MFSFTVVRASTCYSVCMCVSVYRSEDNFTGTVVSYHVGPEDQTQIINIISQCLGLWSHPEGSKMESQVVGLFQYLMMILLVSSLLYVWIQVFLFPFIDMEPVHMEFLRNREFLGPNLCLS